MRMYRAYRDHGILYTEYMAQPRGWWDDMFVCQDMFLTRMEENRPNPPPKLGDVQPMDEVVRPKRRSEKTDG